MKTNKLLPIIILIGVAILFFFPNPESNFPAYLGTALFFIILIIYLSKKSNNRKT